MPDTTQAGALSERELLLGELAAQRHHVLSAVDGLTDAQLRQTLVPSGWSPVGLVRHLALGDERYWFHTVMGGLPLDYWPEKADSSSRPADWFVADDESPQAVINEYRQAIAEADLIIDRMDLSAPPQRPEDWWASAGVQFPDLRSVIIHVLVDTATHAGHLDIVRELIDGKQQLVL
jgi:hypothetical protein